MSEMRESQKRKIRFILDGKEVEAMEGWTVLDTARQNGVHIPTLCFNEAVKTSGACRLCVVEVKQGGWSKIVISCMYPPTEGLEVLSRSERVMNVRRWILEMLLAECPASKEIRVLAEEYGVKRTRFEIKNPEEQCLLCGLCVRACEEVVGVRAISFGSRGVTKKITTPYMIPNKSCIACGSCVTICPTGAMQARLDAVRGAVSERTGKGFAH